MPRKATDLLDVFRQQRAEPARSAPRAKDPEPRRQGFQGLVLLPRHVLLGSAVGVLLVVFAFVLGLSLGKRDGGGPRASQQGSLSHVSGGKFEERATDNVRRVYVEARLPYLDPVRKAVNDPGTLRATLVRTKSVPPERIWLLDDLASAQLRILLGPFPAQEQAAEYLHRAGFFTFRLGGVVPWKDPEYLLLTERELPLQHLPNR